MLTCNKSKTENITGYCFNILVLSILSVVAVIFGSSLSFAAHNSYDKSVTTVDRIGNFNKITLDYSADLNAPANFNEIFLSDVYLDHFDGKSVATLVFRVQKTQGEIIRGVGAYIKASPRMPLPDYIAKDASFEGYVYSIEKTNPNIYMIRFPIRRVHDSFEYDLRIDALAYYVDLQQAPYGEGMIKRLWVTNSGRDFTHEDIFNGSLEKWNKNMTNFGNSRETYTIRPNSPIFDAARKYYGCTGLFID